MQAWRTFSWQERMCCRRFRSCFASKLHWSHMNLQHIRIRIQAKVLKTKWRKFQLKKNRSQHIFSTKNSVQSMKDFNVGFLCFFLVLCTLFNTASPATPFPTVSEDAGTEPRTVASLALTARSSNYLARSHPQTRVRSHPHSARSHPQLG